MRGGGGGGRKGGGEYESIYNMKKFENRIAVRNNKIKCKKD